TCIVRLKRVHDWEVGGIGSTGDVCIPRRVHCNAGAGFITAAPDVGAVLHSADTVEFGYEAILTTANGGLVRVEERETGRIGFASKVRVIGGVHCQCVATLVTPPSPERAEH